MTTITRERPNVYRVPSSRNSEIEYTIQVNGYRADCNCEGASSAHRVGNTCKHERLALEAAAVDSDSPIARRFWSKVDRSGECWIWTAAQFSNGYGHFVSGGRAATTNHPAHRFAFELAYGLIGDRALLVCHQCDVKACVRPTHLKLGTKRTNMQEAIDRGQMPVGEDSPSAKLTEIEVHTIRTRYLAGEPSRLLAQEYGIQQGHVTRLVRGERWRHIQ